MLVAERSRRGIDNVVFAIRAWPLELVNQRPMDPEFLRTEIVALRATVAPDLFTGFDTSTFPATSLPALALTAVAYRHDDATGEQVALALRTQLFERGLDIATPNVLQGVAAQFGLDVPDVESERANIHADWEEGQARGVAGSPHFFIGDKDFFCPTLTIRHDDSGFEIAIDNESVEMFFHSCFDGA